MPQGCNNPDAENAGSLWSTKLEDELLEMIRSGNTSEQCAIHFKRTSGGIRARQLVIAKRLVGNGNTIEEASSIVNVPIQSIQQSLRASEVARSNLQKRKEQANPKDSIRETLLIVDTIKPDTPLSVLKEIRDLIKDFIASQSKQVDGHAM